MTVSEQNAEECRFIKKCPQWITEDDYYGFCVSRFPDFHRGDCRKYLDLHKTGQTDTKRPREWKALEK